MKPAKSLAVIGLVCVCSVLQAPAQEAQLFHFSNINIGFGARALAMGGAFIAIADDITAMSFNPAGLAQLLKPEFSFGLKYGKDSTEAPTILEGDLFIPGYEYDFRGFTFGYVGGIVPFRIARIPFAIGIAYQMKESRAQEYSFPYRQYVDGVLTTDSTFSYNNSGGNYALTFSLATRPLEFLHLGANLNLIRESSKMRRLAEFWDNGTSMGTMYQNEDVHYTGGMSFDLGLLIKTKAVSLGLVYRSPYRTDYENLGSYGYSINNSDGSVSTYDTSWTWAVENRWPYSFGAGLALRPVELLTLSSDLTYTKWTKAKDIWSFDGYPLEGLVDSWQLRTGLEYIVFIKRMPVPLRAGWFMDKPYWVETDRDGKAIKFHSFTCGFGLSLSRLIVDVAAVYTYTSYFANDIDRDKLNRYSFGLHMAVSYRFGK
jgi:long-chain fatty acid transport protein